MSNNWRLPNTCMLKDRMKPPPKVSRSESASKRSQPNHLIASPTWHWLHTIQQRSSWYYSKKISSKCWHKIHKICAVQSMDPIYKEYNETGHEAVVERSGIPGIPARAPPLARNSRGIYRFTRWNSRRNPWWNAKQKKRWNTLIRKRYQHTSNHLIRIQIIGIIGIWIVASILQLRWSNINAANNRRS